MRQIFSIARSYNLTNADLATIASEILGRTVDSISEDNGFSDKEMFVLWCTIRGTSEVNAARLYNGNLHALADELQRVDNEDIGNDKCSWLNL